MGNRLDLGEFTALIRDYWRQLEPTVAGFRPRAALIDIPEEGGLEFLCHMAQRRIGQQDIADVIFAVELYHQEKQGNNVRMLRAERILSNSMLLTEYERLRPMLGSPLFKILRLQNLVAERPWYVGAQKLFIEYPVEWFIQTPRTPAIPFFGRDARRHFEARMKELERREKHSMQTTQPDLLDDALARRVYQLIGAYLQHKALQRSKLKLEQIPINEKGKRSYPHDYREAVQKVATDAFLAMRGRNERDFIDYFTGTICSVPQYFGKEEEFVTVSRALLEQPTTVKNLAMLALSARSWFPNPKQDSQTDDTEQGSAA